MQLLQATKTQTEQLFMPYERTSSKQPWWSIKSAKDVKHKVPSGLEKRMECACGASAYGASAVVEQQSVGQMCGQLQRLMKKGALMSRELGRHCKHHRFWLG